MLGYLVACGGGKTVPLREERMFIGRRRDPAASEPAKPVAPGQPAPPAKPPAPLCELRMVDGVWFVRHLEGPISLQVNGVQVTASRLLPRDVLTVGRSRYTIEYFAPTDANTRPVPPVTGAAANSDASATDCGLGRLVPCAGGTVIPLTRQRQSIGRNKTCDIVLPFQTISGLHCGLELVSGYWRIVDLGSQNGVRVNGVPYRKRWLLPGDTVTLAIHAFRVEYTPAGPRPSFDEDEHEAIRDGSLLDRAGIRETALEAKLPKEEPVVDPGRRKFQL